MGSQRATRLSDFTFTLKHKNFKFWASLVVQWLRLHTLNAGGPGLIPASGRPPEEGISYPLQYSWACLVAQMVKNPTCNAGDLGSNPGL